MSIRGVSQRKSLHPCDRGAAVLFRCVRLRLRPCSRLRPVCILDQFEAVVALIKRSNRAPIPAVRPRSLWKFAGTEYAVGRV
jgi:hypothetical protein